MIYTVRQGQRYRATLRLSFIEQFAGNDMIAERLRAAGFSEVSVAGSGADRVAEAIWPNADTSADLPPQVHEVEELS